MSIECVRKIPRPVPEPPDRETSGDQARNLRPRELLERFEELPRLVRYFLATRPDLKEIRDRAPQMGSKRGPRPTQAYPKGATSGRTSSARSIHGPANWSSLIVPAPRRGGFPDVLGTDGRG